MPEDVVVADAPVVDGGSTETAPEGASETTTTGAEGVDASEQSQELEPRFTVRVGGREIEATLEELQQGFMRQQDYTQKTQTLAAERQRLAQLDSLAVALEKNPEATLQALARSLGVTLNQAAAVVEEALDPQEAMLREVVQHQREDLARRQAEEASKTQAAQVETELSDLKAKVGDFDRETVLRYAVENQIPNLHAAWKAMELDRRIDAEVAAKNAETAKKVASKRSAQIVEGGSSPQKGSTTPDLGKKPSLREAFRAAIASATT